MKHLANLLEGAVAVTPYLKRRARELSVRARKLASTEEDAGQTHLELYRRVAESLDETFGTRPLPLVVHQLRAAAEMVLAVE